MSARLFLLLSVALLTVNCGGGDKHLPSSNPPEYDPKKVYTAPAASLSAPATVTKPTELDLLRSKLDSLESGAKGKGEGKKVQVDPNSLQLFKGVTNPCEALSRLAPGLGSAQLFAGDEGAALKKALGPDADGIARRMDEQLAEGLKHSLGPGAADCPISVRPQKRSALSQPARLVLTHASSTQPLLLAQTTIPDTSQDDYYVQDPPPRTENAPPDWVGWSTTDTMVRIGKDDRPTKGIRERYEMIIAPKAKQCPHLEGPELKGMVDGTFEWSFVMYRATPGPDGATREVLYRRHVKADLKGEVDDDAQLKKVVKFDATVTLQHIGTELPYYSQPHHVQGEFSIDQRTGIPQEFKIITVSGFSEGEAEIKDAQLLGTLTALMAYFSGLEYSRAQAIWNNPNTCVEVTFTPATKTKKFVPNESTPVKTELRTKKEQAVVPAKFKEARERPRERNGTVSPREARSQPDTPATFTYRAPGTRVRHSGFWVGVVSRAGVAEAIDGEWELADASYVLEFQSRIVSTGIADPAQSQASAVIPLVASGEVSPSGDTKYIGQGMIAYQTGPLPNWNACAALVQGQGTIPMRVFQTFIHVESPRSGSNASQEGSTKIALLYGIIGGSQETNTGGIPAYIDYQCFPNKPKPYCFWSCFYISGRHEVSPDPMVMFLLKDWTYVGQNGVVATKTLRSTCGGMCDQEVATFTLKEGDGSEGTQPSQ